MPHNRLQNRLATILGPPDDHCQRGRDGHSVAGLVPLTPPPPGFPVTSLGRAAPPFPCSGVGMTDLSGFVDPRRQCENGTAVCKGRNLRYLLHKIRIYLVK